MITKVSCTRMELLAHKAQIKLARQGRDLLEQKRTALMKELLHMADTVMEHSDILQQVATEAGKKLAYAESLAGREAVQSAALASRKEVPLHVSTTNVMGVRVPHIEQKRFERSLLGRGYSIVGTSITIDETASAFEAQVEAILQLAESELRLRRLAAEIQRTSRRLNALDHLLIVVIISNPGYMMVIGHYASSHSKVIVSAPVLPALAVVSTLN